MIQTEIKLMTAALSDCKYHYVTADGSKEYEIPAILPLGGLQEEANQFMSWRAQHVKMTANEVCQPSPYNVVTLNATANCPLLSRAGNAASGQLFGVNFVDLDAQREKEMEPKNKERMPK